MARCIRLIIIILFKFIGVINNIIPKNEKRILFFTNIERFNDNNIALFEYLCQRNNNYVMYYSTPDYRDMQTIYSEKKDIQFISPRKAVLIFMLAKYVFYDAGTIHIKPGKNQIVVSMWHGTPLKKIGRGAEKRHSTKIDSFCDFSFIITTSKEFVPIFAESFECSKSMVKVMGYPRNDYLFTKKDINFFAALKIKTCSKMVIWMPTFRKSKNCVYTNTSREIESFELPLFETIDDLKTLDTYCYENNIGLVIKLHPHSVLNNYVELLPKFENITVVTNYMLYTKRIQNYRFLSQFDSLITDYSSVYFDYMLLNRSIYFVLDDLEDYRVSRGFIFDNPLSWMPGEKIVNKAEFYVALNHISNNIDLYEEQRIQLCKRIHSMSTSANSCQALLNYVGISL